MSLTGSRLCVLSPLNSMQFEIASFPCLALILQMRSRARTVSCLHITRLYQAHNSRWSRRFHSESRLGPLCGAGLRERCPSRQSLELERYGSSWQVWLLSSSTPCSGSDTCQAPTVQFLQLVTLWRMCSDGQGSQVLASMSPQAGRYRLGSSVG